MLGAVVAGQSGTFENAMGAYGRHIGTAFQLVDDALDYGSSSDALGKNIGDDLAEGKPTLPLIRVMVAGNEAERALVRHAIEQGGKSDLEGVVAAIHRVGALEYARDRARAEAAAATTRLEGLPDSPCRDSLLQLAHFSVERKF